MRPSNTGLLTAKHLKEISGIFVISLMLNGCGGSSASSPAEVIDTTPDQFTFTDITNQNTNTLIESAPIIITGINSATSLSIVDGEFSINEGEYTTTAVTVKENDKVTVRRISAMDYASTTNITLNIGTVSDTFTITTHSENTRFANKITDDLNAQFSIINQPRKGRVIVSPDLHSITYESLNAYDYLKSGESAQETISVSMLGSAVTHDVTFNIAGVTNESQCHDRTIIDVEASTKSQQYPSIDEGSCVRISAPALSAGTIWHAWTGPSGAYRGQLFSTVGVDSRANELIFLPPAPGKYNLSWCPESGECIASYYFESDTADTKQVVKSELTIENEVINEAATLAVSLEDGLSDDNFTYHWIIHHWSESYTVLIDVITTENTLELPLANIDDNYFVYVVADDNNFQLEGGFSSARTSRLEIIRRSVSTLGNYATNEEVINIRSPESVKKPPQLIVMVEGDNKRYEWAPDVVYDINAVKGSKINLDMSESTDEDSDSLSYSINYRSIGASYTLDVKGSFRFSICADDGFQWTYEENPCVYFDLIVNE